VLTVAEDFLKSKLLERVLGAERSEV